MPAFVAPVPRAYAGRAACGSRCGAPALVFVVVVVASGSAAAHHDVAVQRVGGAGLGASGLLGGLERPSLTFDLAWELGVFGRALAGTRRHPVEAPTATIQLLVLGAHLDLASGLGFGVSLPAGWVRWSGPESQLGLGDLRLAVTGAWPVRSAGLRVRLLGALIVPTGAYARDAAFSSTELEGGPGGELRLVTWDTRASLGAGAFAAMAGVDVAWRWLPRLDLELGAGFVQPLGRTPDEVRWGHDLRLSPGLRVGVSEVLSLEGGAELRRHGRDRVPREDGTRRDVGGRDEVGVRFGLRLELRRGLACAVRAHLPVWQRAGGVQLVESGSGSAACTLGLGL